MTGCVNTGFNPTLTRTLKTYLVITLTNTFERFFCQFLVLYGTFLTHVSVCMCAFLGLILIQGADWEKGLGMGDRLCKHTAHYE